MLINCVVYQDGRKLAEIDQSEIHAHLTRSDCFVWVALQDAADEELERMQAQFDLHPLAVEDARHGHQRPKIEEYGDSLFVVLHMIEPDGDALRVGEVNIFVGRNYVLSVRNRAEKGFRDVRARCEREPELLRHGSGYVLYALMDAVVDRYFPNVDRLESELEAIEAKIFDGRTTQANVEALYALKRKLTTVKHATGPMVEATSRLFGGRVPPVCSGMTEYFRDVYDHLVRLNQTIDSVRDTLITALSVNLSLITLEDNKVTKRLASYAALVAVPTLIAGIYGMNFQHMPELQWQYGYAVAVGAMTTIDLVLFWRFRKAGWL